MKDTLKDALNEIDDTYIAEAAEPYRRNSMVSWLVASAAMLVLLIGIALMLGKDPGGPVQIGSQPNHSTGTPPFSSYFPSSVVPSWSYPPTQPSNVFPGTTSPTVPPTYTPQQPTNPIVPPTYPDEPPPIPPPLPPNTIPLSNFLLWPEIIREIQQIGSRPENSSLSPTMPAYQCGINLVVVAKVKDVLPDVYQDPLTTRYYHILKMEMLDNVNVKNMPREFYLRLSTHLSTDLDIFTRLVLSIQQVGIENYLMINQDLSQMQPFSLLFELYSDQGMYGSLGDLIAFTDGVWDQRLYKMKGWERPSALTSDYPVCDEYNTIEDCRSRILKISSKNNIPTKRVYTAKDIATGTAQEEFLEWVKPFRNGVYAQKFKESGTVYYTRLINNFPTNEVIRVSQEEANWLSEHFTEEDLFSLPDLGAFMTDLQLYKLETMNSPHSDFYKDKEVYLKSIWAEGKYYKVNGHIYGLVKVCWAYWTNRSSNAHKWPGSYVDAMYYLISADGSYVVAQRDEIAKLLGEDFLEPEYDVLEPFPPV